ncbi:MAG: cytoplasmic protein [Opitutaceae bacterium]|nr:cytoplasmic protein [Opitutaceae bacterium]
MSANEEFISESVTPDPAALDASTAALGEPAIPLRFSWRGTSYAVTRVLARHKGYGADRTHGSGELYLHRHWLEVEVDDGSIMKLYFERQPASRRSTKARWWLYSRRRA